jgi:hypothetical protein
MESPKRRVGCIWLGNLRDLSSKQDGGVEKNFLNFIDSCQQFSSMIAVRPPSSGAAVFMEVGGSRRLWVEESISRRVQVLSRRWGLESKFQQIAFAETAGEALVLARARSLGRKFQSVDELDLEFLEFWVQPFGQPTDDEKGVLSRILDQFSFLGLKNIGEFRRLPPDTLASRFGKSGVWMSARLRGEVPESWQGFVFPEKVSEEIQFDEFQGGLSGQREGASLESLLFVLKPLLDRVSARLWARGVRASELVLRFHFEGERFLAARGESAYREVRAQFAVPQGGSRALLGVLSELLRHEFERVPLAAAVDRVALEVLSSVPGIGGQKHFFDTSEEESERIADVLNRIVARIGRESVRELRWQTSYFPERASELCTWGDPHPGDHDDLDQKDPFLFSRGLKARRGKEGAWALKEREGMPSLQLAQTTPWRPSRLLTTPKVLQRVGRWLVSPAGEAWKIRRCSKPERMTEEWWRDSTAHSFGAIAGDEETALEDPAFLERLWGESLKSREYYQVETEAGDLLWVFVQGRGALGELDGVEFSDRTRIYLQGIED